MNRVLIADSDRDMRRLIASWLRKRGLRVEEAVDSAQLDDLLRRAAGGDPPRAIVVDISMLGPGSADALRRLSRVRLVITTAFGSGQAPALNDLDATAVLEKPFDLRRLASIVASEIGAHG